MPSRRCPACETVSPLNTSQLKADGVSGKPFGSGLDPATFDKVWDLNIDKGPPNVISTLGPRDILLEKDFAESNSFDLGDTVRATTPVGEQARPQGARHLRRQGRTGRRLRRDRTDHPTESSACGTTSWSSSPCSLEQTQRRSSHGSTGCWKQRFPIAEAQSQKEFQDSITGNIDQFLFLIYALLSLSVIVSLFGIVNTLVLSIHERTREIGMMRAIGTPTEPGAADRALRVGDHGADRCDARPRGRASSWASSPRSRSRTRDSSCRSRT